MQRGSSHSFEKVNAKKRDVVSPRSQGLAEIIAKKTPPGILVFSADNHLVYINKEAYAMFTSQTIKGNKSHNSSSSASYIPKGIRRLCNKLRLMVSTSRPEILDFVNSGAPSLVTLPSVGQEGSSFRAIWLGDTQSGSALSGHILVLIEPAVT